jgi:HPt (histidine-containing phosphotransfer) domain-containing protein
MPRGAGGVSAAYDRDKLVELFGNDPTTLARSSASSSTPPGARARDRRDRRSRTIARAAHRLKGASGMIGAAPLHQIAEAIERAAKAHDLETVRAWRPGSSRDPARGGPARACPRRSWLRLTQPQKRKLAPMIGPYRTWLIADGVDARA